MEARKLIATALILWVGGVYAAPPKEDLNTRVTRLEQLMESQALSDMLTQIDALQQEVQRLRGQLEEQAHKLESAERRQRELYLDIDRRLSRMEQSTASAAAQSAKDPEDEQGAYQKAFDLLRDLHYDEAIAAFHRYLERYPDGSNAQVAQYWIGEAKYAQRDFKSAITEYQRLIDTYPSSPKIAEAMLKIGNSHKQLGNRAAAKKVLSNLVAKFPKSTEAGQARTLIRQMKSKR